ncbi:flavin reductase [Dactylosporangium sp. NPDC005555]|uniref:flavin reductase n=1 Tax=Dactylosporangium sp. NPDC005555 TaxID=3154889 RepID=UPI00339E2407
MTIDPDTFRSVLAQWPSGVSVVTTVAGDGWHGMTASSFSSVSMDPPLILVCLNRRITTHALIEASGVFAVSVLAKDQAMVGRRFAGQVAGEDGVTDRFAGGAWETRTTGAPVLTDAVGWLDCRVVHAYAGGDHTIFVGAVLGASTERIVAPLLFHSRAWGQLADVLPDKVGVADSGLLAALRTHTVSAGVAGRLATALRAAGVRVRVRDAYGCLTSSGDRRTATALVATADEVADAALGGAGVLELVAGDPVVTKHILDEADRYDMTATCWLPDAFAPDRTADVLDAVDMLAALGCDEIGLDEGAEAASPRQVRALLQDATVRASTRLRPVSLRVRLRDRHGLGLVNALTAMKSGVRHFDTTLGGIDGVLACEDVQFLADRLGVACDSPRAALVAAAADLERHLGGALPGRTYRVSVS